MNNLPPTSPPPFTFSELPQDILVRIARLVVHSTNDALSLAHTCKQLCLAVITAKNHTLSLSYKDPASSYTWGYLGLLCKENVRHLILDTSFSTDPPTCNFFALLLCPNLSSVVLRAAEAPLSLLRRRSLTEANNFAHLRRLSLHVQYVKLHDAVMATLRTLQNLDDLTLSYTADCSVSRMPHAGQCACRPLRQSPQALVEACHTVSTLAIFCTCLAAAECTVPPLRNLRNLSLGGRLPTEAPHQLREAGKWLQNLQLINAYNCVKLAESLKESGIVTGVVCLLHPAHRPLNATEVRKLAQACPRLETLACNLVRDAEYSVLLLPTTLRTLVIGFENKTFGDVRDASVYHPLPNGIIRSICTRFQKLHDVVLTRTALSDGDVDDLFKFAGGRLTRLYLPIDGQMEKKDHRLVRILRGVATKCEKLTVLDVHSIPQRAAELLQVGIDARRDEHACIGEIRRALSAVQRRLPFLDVESVHKVVEMIEEGF